MNTLPMFDMCCRPCESPVIQNIPGPIGPAGPAGVDGGVSAKSYSITSGSFAMPAEGAAVAVDVDATAWMAVGQIVYVEGAGYMRVDVINSVTNVDLINAEDTAGGMYISNAAPATVIATLAKVSPAGEQGSSGAITGLVAGGDLKGFYLDPKLLLANAKGSMIVGDGVDASTLSPGTNGQVPVFDSVAALGMAAKTLIPNAAIINSVPRLSAATGTPIPLGVPPTQGVILTDDGNLQTTGGNARGTNAVDLQTARALATQVASGLRSFVGGGANNTAGAIDSVVVGGNTNSLNASATNGVIVGGTSNTMGAVALRGFLGGGHSNQVTDGYGFLGGGFQNISGAGATGYTVVCGGDRNQATGARGFVGGGQLNLATGSLSSVVGGSGNAASFDGSFIGGGNNNISSNTASVVAGGRSNQATGGDSSVMGGLYNQATGLSSSVIGGQEALANKHGQVAHSAGQFTAVGDCQSSQVQWRCLTPDATQAELFLDGAGGTARSTLVTNSAWGFIGHLVGRRNNGDTAVWKFEGAVKNNGGTASIIGAVTITLLGADAGCSATWGVAGSISIDATSNYLRFRVTGTAANIIRWTAVAQLTELSF